MEGGDNMAVLSKEKLLESVSERFKDDTSDEVLSFIEDITDTINSYVSGEDWKTKYEENDAAWRQRYKERFFSTDVEKPKDETVIVSEENVDGPENEPTKYEDLFETKGE